MIIGPFTGIIPFSEFDGLIIDFFVGTGVLITGITGDVSFGSPRIEKSATASALPHPKT